MNSFAAEATVGSFAYENLGHVLNDCVEFYNQNLRQITNASETRLKRRALTKWIRKFHQDCGTLTPEVEQALGNLEDPHCLLLMTAHQPNLFAYSGVFRKATLNHVLSENLSKRLDVPVACFFGIADQDFTDDRWVKSAILPDVERRNGVLELRANLPKHLMLNKAKKPSEHLLGAWRKQIETWYDQKYDSASRSCKALQLDFTAARAVLAKNFEAFWEIVETAHSRAKNFADFNAFVISQIVNGIWGYPTIFARFSECQQIFESQFCFLLSHFQEYSQNLKGVASSPNLGNGVFADEYKTLPFWYHCECGSKARLEAKLEGDSFVGAGICLRCRKEYLLDFSSKVQPKMQCALPSISARSLSMPLVFFDGLKVGAYVGGVGGREYLRQAKYIAEKLGMVFPPIVVWRPHDIYIGISQLDALLSFRLLSGTFDLSKITSVISDLKVKLRVIEASLQQLDARKEKLAETVETDRKEVILETMEIAAEQNKIRSKTGFTVFIRELKLLENMLEVARLYPSIIDYAVNIGISAVSEQWLAFLRGNQSLLSDVTMETGFANFVQTVWPGLIDEWQGLQYPNSKN